MSKAAIIPDEIKTLLRGTNIDPDDVVELEITYHIFEGSHLSVKLKSKLDKIEMDVKVGLDA